MIGVWFLWFKKGVLWFDKIFCALEILFGVLGTLKRGFVGWVFVYEN